MILYHLKCFSERLTKMVHVHTCIPFKPCSEALEMRRRKAARRRKYTAQLKAIATKLAKKKRTRPNSKFSLNRIAKKMRKEVRRMDRRDQTLWDAYLVYYQQELAYHLTKLKQARNQVDLLSARIGRTKKFSYWLAAVKMFINRVRICLDWYEEWISPNEVKKQLKTYLALMEKYQTTTAAHWIQIHVKSQLEDVLSGMFWKF